MVMVAFSGNNLQASFCGAQVFLLVGGQTERKLTSESGFFQVEVGVGGFDVPNQMTAANKFVAYQTWAFFPKTDNLVSRNSLP